MGIVLLLTQCRACRAKCTWKLRTPPPFLLPLCMTSPLIFGDELSCPEMECELLPTTPCSSVAGGYDGGDGEWLSE